MVSKSFRPWAPTFLLLILLLQGGQSKTSLGTTWNDRIKDILVSITAKIPPIEGIPIGEIVSTLLKIFWPESEVDIWSLIKDQVEHLVDKKILEFELQERQNEIRALQKTMEMYVEAQVREKGSLMSSMIHASNELFYKLTQSSNKPQLIPLLVTHSAQHLIILKERLLHGKEMYEEDNSKIWKSDLESQIKLYKDSFTSGYSAWIEWRKGRIIVDVGVHTYPMPVPPFFRWEPYGRVHDEITGHEHKFFYTPIVGPNEPNFFKTICETVKKNLFSIQNGQMLQLLVTTFYLDNFVPGKEDDPSVIPPSMATATFGPISPGIQMAFSERYVIYSPGNDNNNYGEITDVYVWEWNQIDGLQFFYERGSGWFSGKSGGGFKHEVSVANKHIKSLKVCINNCNVIELTIGFSNGESTGRLGNRGSWVVECTETGGIDTYGLYNVRKVGGGCGSGLYQIELDYKAYPTKPSQIDSYKSHLIDDSALKYRSTRDVNKIRCCRETMPYMSTIE
ncbi:uncharacterized protein LOC128492514 [Spea bombifrons]|uniref:uncharacterized protein LOC128492514 n=1 Tax=Spea bombifrons TaxID=233779 RepID=UPI002349FEAE|nr:uncharacterized protein LOC128492514 [Spea bombifrons]